jgi:hypothetical protein
VDPTFIASTSEPVAAAELELFTLEELTELEAKVALELAFSIELEAMLKLDDTMLTLDETFALELGCTAAPPQPVKTHPIKRGGSPCRLYLPEKKFIHLFIILSPCNRFVKFDNSQSINLFQLIPH